MKLIRLTALMAFGVVASGCAAQHMSQYPAAIDASVQTDLKAQVSVGNVITGESKMNIIMSIFAIGDSKFADGVVFGSGGGASIGLPDPISKTKAAAAYKAISAAGADVIIAPRYVVDVVDYVVFKQVTVKVTGYAGKITSVR
jgi:hypothetical protein